ncbi:hypothetical protein DMN91_003243 [Ooceraea biroi]|uniref:Uncharacterized protein n=1 Tax=Ooceraea biroi TaxID=2015173 RepID=A0A3L8DXH6_OOCBI|nr:hypothetical protein DMN91_003243 [Ooceraea biroi]
MSAALQREIAKAKKILHPNSRKAIAIAKKTKKYIGRNDEELEQITLKHSIGRRNRQHASREDIIRMTKKREQEEFNTCGIGI